MKYYDIKGKLLTSVYDIHGKLLTGESGGDSGGGEVAVDDYNVADTDYQRAILSARDAWASEYRADSSIIPLMIHTDQHGYLDAAHKPTFSYLGKALKINELSAFIGLGDVCSGTYTEGQFNSMLTCLAGIEKTKQINIYGNHDVWAKKIDGSSYSYSIITDEKWDALANNYFDNRTYGNYHRYDNRGNESMIDIAHHVKYCCFSSWYFLTTNGEVNQPYYNWQVTSEVAEYWIDMLSNTDDNDLIILSHCHPLGNVHDWVSPATDGNNQTVATKSDKTESLGYMSCIIDGMIADRKAKRKGSFTDSNGVVHNYDFTGCTSDLLCTLSGHKHVDCYAINGGVPSIVFDAYRYDNVPLFMVNVDRTKQRVNVWKFDEALNVYNYQIPFN